MGTPSLLPPATLATSRLMLRAPVLADAAALFAAYGHDPEVTRYLEWGPHADVASFEGFLRDALADAAAHPANRWLWILVPREEEVPVGMIDARGQGPRVSVGYVLARRCWGNGYMAEALQPIVDWAIAQDGIHRVWAVCDVENGASARVLEKVGMRREGILRSFTVHPSLGSAARDCIAYSRVRTDVR